MADENSVPVQSKEDETYDTLLPQPRVRKVPENIGVGFINKEDDEKASCKSKRSLFSYLASEITRGYHLEKDEAKYTEKLERVYTFMRTPRELEKFILFGFLQCTDAFLFLFTFLPIRILLALFQGVTHPCIIIFSGSRKILEPAQICDLLKGTILTMGCICLSYVDTSMMYHLIRGQSVIKLYIFYNMLEVADKLFSSFGQDILDALFWTSARPRGKKREHIGVIPHLVLAVFYVILHTLLILFQATTLNVAFNSHNKALLTIMMSNNFVEIKGNLFKRVDKNNLFQISCSDVRERFHYVILLFVVFVRNMTEFSWNPDHIWVIVPDAVIVFMAEFLVDWIKHAFIAKFNEISADVYSDFTVSIAYDMASSRQKHAFTDHSDLVSRRMGFTPIPLACLLFRICSRAFPISGYTGFLIIVVGYMCLMTFKILNSIVLLGKASELITEHRKSKEQQQVVSPTLRTTRRKSFSYEKERQPENVFNFERHPSMASQPLFMGSTTSIGSATFQNPKLTRSEADL